jgi:type IV fimbrial biogenesis protein FimT
MSLHPPAHAHTALGYSLLELLMVLGLMAVLLGLAAPQWQGLHVRWAVRDLAQRYVSTLHSARLLAIRSGQTTTVCPSNNGHGCTQSGLEEGWIVLQGTDTLVQDGAPSRAQGIHTRYGHRTLPMVFAPNGMVDGMGLRQINLCVSQHPSASLALIINQTGRTRWATTQACP